MTSRLIMCAARPVLLFDYDETRREAVGTGRVIDAARLPRELIDKGRPAVSARRINAWWRHRAVPPTRDGIGRTLASMGLNSTLDMLDLSRGLSLSDCYWVKDADDPVQWSAVNFFDNPFDEQLGIALLVSSASSRPLTFDVPDSSTGGDLPKRWMIDASGARVLVKGGRTGQEPVNEVIATGLCRRLGINGVEYHLSTWDNRPVSLCSTMLEAGEELVSAWQVMESMERSNSLSARDQWLADTAEFGCDPAAAGDATDDWLLVDWLMRNTDRHYNNFGLIRDTETLAVRPAPLFDTGASLWCGEITVDGRDYAAKPFYATSRKPTARRQLALIRDWSRFDLSALRDWPEDAAAQLEAQGFLSPTRIAAIRDALHGKILAALAVCQSSRRKCKNDEQS